jgi:hypothetical protein
VTPVPATLIRRFRPKGGAPRPTCTLCGKPYAQRNTSWATLRLPVGAEVPPYRGNEMLVCEAVEPSVKRRKPDAPKGNGIEPGYWDDKHWEVVQEVRRETWDGRWWGGYEPFCTLQCGLDFARAAFRDGARYVRTKETQQ